TGQAEIIQADRNQKVQTFTDFLENLVGNFSTGTFQMNTLIIAFSIANRHTGNISDGLVQNFHITRNFIQTRTITGITGGIGQILRQVITYIITFSFTITAFQMRQNSFKRNDPIMTSATFIDITQINFFFAGSIQKFLFGVGIQFIPRSFQRKAKMLGDFLDHAVIIRSLTVPATNRALANADLGIGNQLVGTEMAAGPQTITDRTGTKRIVERK